jgi:hypothetical protein
VLGNQRAVPSGIGAGFEFIDDAGIWFHRRGRRGTRGRRRWRDCGSGALGGVFLFDDLEAVEKDFGQRRPFQFFFVLLVALAGSVGLREGVSVCSRVCRPVALDRRVAQRRRSLARDVSPGFMRYLPLRVPQSLP